MFLIVCKCTLFFFFNDTATTEIYTLSLHDALPILVVRCVVQVYVWVVVCEGVWVGVLLVFLGMVVVEIGRAHV